MKELKDLIAAAEQRPLVIADCVALINAEVKSKTGLGGMAVKAAFAVVKAFKPRVLEDTVDSLLDEFVAVMQPFYARHQEAGSPGTLEAYFPSQGPEIAEALLGITDRRSQRSKNKTLVGAYNKLRPKGKVHVEQAMPGIGRVLDKHVSSL